MPRFLTVLLLTIEILSQLILPGISFKLPFQFLFPFVPSADINNKRNSGKDTSVNFIRVKDNQQNPIDVPKSPITSPSPSRSSTKVTTSIKRTRSVNPWSLPKLKRSDIRNIKLLFLLSLISVETSTELFVRMPQEIIYGSTPMPITSRKGESSVVVIFPGAGGPDIHTETLKNRIISADRAKGVKRLVTVYDWRPWLGSFLRASFDGQQVGKRVCKQLALDEAQQGNLKHLHAIGISVGSFAADSCVKAYKKTSENPGYTRATFLDPFTSKGIFGYGWGTRNFGKWADIAESYLNADDPVPTTNDPLNLAHTYDITNANLKKEFTPVKGESYHSWPGNEIYSRYFFPSVFESN